VIRRAFPTSAAILIGLAFVATFFPPIQAQKAVRPLTVANVRGSHGNAWNAAVVGIAGKSTSLDTQFAMFCSAFGNSSAAATITVELSADDTNYYASSTNTGAVTGNFGIFFQPGARYVRLSSNAASTITATLQCKAP
jgi:hypothetical protein